jgi:hypothetical protein
MPAIAYRIELTYYTDRTENGPQYGTPRYLHTCATLDEARRAASEYAEAYAADLIRDAANYGADGVVVDMRPVGKDGTRYALASSYMVDARGVTPYHDEEADRGDADPLPLDACEEAEEDEEAEGVTLGRSVTWHVEDYLTVNAPIAYVEQRDAFGRLMCTVETPALTHAQMCELRDTQEELADRYSDSEFCRLRYSPLWGVWSELFDCEECDGVLHGDEYEIWPTTIGGTRYYLAGFESQWPWSRAE